MLLSFRGRSSRPKRPEQRECSEPAGKDRDLTHPNQQVWATGRRWQRRKDSNDKVSLLLETNCFIESLLSSLLSNVDVVISYQSINMYMQNLWCSHKPLNHTYSEVLNIERDWHECRVMHCTSPFLIQCVFLCSYHSVACLLLPFLLFYHFLS